MKNEKKKIFENITTGDTLMSYHKITAFLIIVIASHEHILKN